MALQPLGVKAVVDNLPNFLSALKKMDKGVQRTGSRLGSLAGAAGRVGKAVAGMVIGAGAAIAGLGAGMFKLAMDAAPLEGVKDAFAGLTEEIEGGSKAMIEALKEGSAGMVRQTDLMKSFNLAASLVGKDFAVKLPDAMQYLGKVAAATGEDMGFMIDSLVRGVGRLSPMILDNLGIQVDLAAANEAWAEKMGIAVEEMDKTQQQAALMDQVMEKLALSTAELPEVTGSAQQQFAALKTTLADAKDEIGLALLPVVIPLVQKFTELATDAIPKIVNWITTRFVPALQNLQTWIKDKVIPVVQKIATWFKEKLPKAISAVTTWFNETLLPIIRKVVAWFQERLPGAIGESTNWITTKLLPSLRDIWQFIKEYILPFIKALAEAIGETLKLAFEVIAGVWENKLKPALEDLWAFLKEKLQPVWEKIKEVIKIVTEKLKEFAEFLRGIKLPDWLQRGSPSPFELTFIGAGEAIKKLTQVEFPRLQASMQMIAAPAVSAGGREININMGGQTITSGMDLAEFENRVLSIVSRAVGMT